MAANDFPVVMTDSSFPTTADPNDGNPTGFAARRQKVSTPDARHRDLSAFRFIAQPASAA
jgi:hypothetical protein